MNEILQNLHHCFNKKQPVSRGIYAIETGDYIGEFFVYIKTLSTKDYAFLSLPKMEQRLVTAESFNIGIKNKIIVFVEKLPKPVYELCAKQFEKLLITKNKG